MADSPADAQKPLALSPEQVAKLSRRGTEYPLGESVTFSASNGDDRAADCICGFATRIGAYTHGVSTSIAIGQGPIHTSYVALHIQGSANEEEGNTEGREVIDIYCRHEFQGWQHWRKTENHVLPVPPEGTHCQGVPQEIQHWRHGGSWTQDCPA